MLFFLVVVVVVVRKKKWIFFSFVWQMARASPAIPPVIVYADDRRSRWEGYGVTGELIHLNVYKDLIWPDRRSAHLYSYATLKVCAPSFPKAANFHFLLFL